jgi:hypothetical protein
VNKAVSIKVEGIQPIIAPNVKKGRPCTYPFAALKVGQTFWVPGKVNYTALYVAVWRRNRVNAEQQFVLTKGVKDGKSGFRVQRVS